MLKKAVLKFLKSQSIVYMTPVVLSILMAGCSESSRVSTAASQMSVDSASASQAPCFVIVKTDDLNVRDLPGGRAISSQEIGTSLEVIGKRTILVNNESETWIEIKMSDWIHQKSVDDINDCLNNIPSSN